MTFPATTATTSLAAPGLPLILDPTPGSPVISAQIWVETGSMHESSLAGSGISHLLEHMVFKGTDRFSGEQLSLEVQAAGGQWNAYTSFDRTVYYIDGPASSLDLFLSALMEMVFRPTFPEEEFEKEKDVIRREIAMGLDDPDNVGSQLLFRTSYQRDNRRHPVIGHRHLFDAISYEQMKTYHHARYQPENCFLVLSGGFDSNEAQEIIARELSKGLRPPRQFPVSIPREPSQMGSRQASETFAIPATHLSLSWQLPSLDHPDTAPLELLAGILGGGRSTPLYQVLREQRELCHQVGSYAWIPPVGPGLFSIYAEVDPSQTEELITAMHEQIDALAQRTGKDLQPLLNRARRQVATSQFKSLATASGRASDLASNWHQTRNLDYTRDFLEELERVTPEDILRVLSQYLIPEKLTTTTLVPEEHACKNHETQTVSGPGQITEHTLSNGVRVILQHDPKIPVVYGQAVLKAGSLVETPGTAGINSLLSSLLLKGTKTHSALEISETLEDLGASLRPSAGNNTISVSSYCLSEDLATVMPLLAEILSEPSFLGDALNRERSSLDTRIREALQDPASRAFRELRHALWQGQGYGIPTSGTLESLPNITPEKLIQHHRDYFTGENLVLALFGDLDPEKTLSLLEDCFTVLPSGKAPSPLSFISPQAGEKTITLEKEQAVLAIGYPGLAAGDDRRYALQLIDSWCSDMAGPLFTRIREELGLAYFVSSTTFLGLNTGLSAFYLGTAPEQLDFARRELEGQIDQLIESGIPADVLTSVKANASASEALRNQNPGSRARIASLDVLLGFPADAHLQLNEKLQAVTEEEIKNLAQDLYAPEKAMTLQVTPGQS